MPEKLRHPDNPYGLFNFRDLGGMKTLCSRKIRSRLLFRTGNTGQILPNGAALLKEELGIGSYVDFRTDAEIKAFGKPETLLAAGIEWRNLHINTDDPMFSTVRRPNAKDWTSFYIRLFEKNVKTWVEFLHLILASESPMMYGCVFGKDRTGIATSFLLTTLDVHEEHIHEDYALTTKSMVPHYYERFSVFWDNSDLTSSEVYQHYLQAHPEIIADFVSHIRARDEEIFQILDGSGFRHADREKLKSKLLVD